MQRKQAMQNENYVHFYILNLMQKQLGCTIRHVKKQWECRNKFGR